ncbi:MAG: acyltransferase [Acidobacteriota bacterium]|nr:acyltransferase [Acidobacteriota bacterium]
MKAILKTLALAAVLLLTWPMALLSGFGRFPALFTIFAHVCAAAPGLIGDFLRVAYYRLTLSRCPMTSRISFGSFFAHPRAGIGEGVYIGAYCILGRTSIGSRTQIASGVQILSGGRQHSRDREGRIQGSEQGEFQSISIGEDCWIGASAIVMADVGARSTIGAGSVVTRSIPPDSVAVGSPARVLDTVEKA